MVTKASRRILGFLAAVSLSLVPATSQPLSVAASGGGTLFGLGPSAVVKVDPATGSLTPFASLPLRPNSSPLQSFGGLVSDAIGHRLFTNRVAYSGDFSTAYYNLVTINSQTAAVTIGPNMVSGITDMVYDPSSGSLFGQTNMCCPFEFVRIDPATGAQTRIGDVPGVQPLRMTIAPNKHEVYFATESFILGQPQPVITLVTINTSTGLISQSPPMAAGLFAVVYDTASGNLFGKTFCCPATLVRVDPASGAQTLVAAGLNIGGGITIDSASHTVYMTADEFGAFGFQQFIQSVNDQTGAKSLSSGPLPMNTYVGALAFEGVAITPESIKADVRNALASGAISNAGVANSLLAELSAAQDARSRGQCDVAGNIYQAFTNEVNAQSGKAIATATATQLASEAQFLIAHCP